MRLSLPAVTQEPNYNLIESPKSSYLDVNGVCSPQHCSLARKKGLSKYESQGKPWLYSLLCAPTAPTKLIIQYCSMVLQTINTRNSKTNRFAKQMRKSEPTLQKFNSLHYGSFITSTAVLTVVAQSQP